MSNLVGNLGLKVSSQLPCPLISIPLVSKRLQVMCLRNRDCSSSIPVRYIPKKSSKVKISETSPSNDVKGSRYPSWSDASASSISEGSYRRIVYEEVSHTHYELELKSYVENSEHDFEKMEEHEEAMEEIIVNQVQDCNPPEVLLADKCVHDAEKLATEFLAMRSLTAGELKKKLYGRSFSTDTVEELINKFQNRGFINDRLYAEAFSRSRWSSSSWGPRRIKQALTKKGVSQVDAENAIKLVFDEGGCDSDQGSNLGLSKHAMDKLYVQASKYWLRGGDVSKERKKSRIVRWLQYRGFDWSVIGVILKKLDN